MSRTVSMMQPYLFPYLGYFQLIANSDAFVLGDDLQYVKASWINRNRILVNGEPRLITFSLKKGGQFDAIGARWLGDDFEREAARFLKTLKLAYGKAPHHDEVLTLVEDVLAHPERNLARFIEHSIRAICLHLGIDTPLYRESDFRLESGIDKQDRMIQLTRRLEGQRYVNPVGGMQLYCPAYFRTHGLQLRFLRMRDIVYPQFRHPFVPSLSIIDVLMFNSRARVIELLDSFELLEGLEPSAGSPARPVCHAEPSD